MLRVFLGPTHSHASQKALGDPRTATRLDTIPVVEWPKLRATIQAELGARPSLHPSLSWFPGRGSSFWASCRPPILVLRYLGVLQFQQHPYANYPHPAYTNLLSTPLISTTSCASASASGFRPTIKPLRQSLHGTRYQCRSTS